jgi:hypothetical protein
MHVSIGTPMYGGMCHGSFMTSVFELNSILKENGHTMSLEFLYNESLIQRARNKIANKFLQSSDSDILLFIDSDIEFNPYEIYQMLLFDKDIMGAVVPLKALNFEHIRLATFMKKNSVDLPYFGGYFNINCEKDAIKEDVLNNRPFKVDRIGAAMLSIKKSVLEKMSETCEVYKENTPYTTQAPPFYDFFPVKIENGVLMSEDFSFCNKAREIGYDIHATAYPLISHSGMYLFKGNLTYEMNLIKEYNELQERNKK